MSKNLDQSLNDLLANLELPSDDEVKEDTRREKLSQFATGRTKSDQTLANMKKAAKKKAQDPNWIAARNMAQAKLKKDKKKVAEISKKISAKSKGRKHSEETKQHLSKIRKGVVSWNKGISPSKATKEKLSLAHKGKKLAIDTKLKIKNNAAKNKTIHTPEGIFISRTQAAEHYFYKKKTHLGSVNSTSVWIYRQLTKDPDNFYYIT
jgi:hypothetical protein